VFDIAGVYPLKMRVVGVLARNHTADDLAVFVDLKTAWVVQGLVHGHEDVTRTQDSGVIIDRSSTSVVASAKLIEYTEITEENIDSFHFHGAPDSYPLSAVIVVPTDEKSGTILRGRYLEGNSPHQLVVPETVVDGLLANIFRIKNVLDAVIFVVAIATVLALVLVFALSLRLRQREIHTVFRIGGSRLTIARLFAAEITIVVVASALLCAIGLVIINQFSDELVRTLFIR
jgi:putative ABC transport system permease protein